MCVLFIDKLKTDVDKTLINITFDYTSDKVHELMIDVTLETFATLEKLVIYLKVSVPEDENDFQFKKEKLKTVFDISKLVRGMYGNPLIKTFLETFLKSANVTAAFPIKAVRFEVEI